MSDDFYRREPGPLSQGDVVLAPFARLMAADADPPRGMELDPDGLRLDGGDLPDARVIVKLSACMVVSHDCQLDKEFNREVTRLHRDGMPVRDARDAAEGDRTLDRWVVVAPILGPDEIAADLAAVARGDVVGLFHLPHHDALGGEGVVDLAVKATVDRLICRRAAGLTAAAADLMRSALMRTDLARRPIGLAEVERALGTKLVDITVDQKSPVRATLHFANGEALAIARPPHAGTPGGTARTERSAP
ncbi:MAG TPA: hypothetical protein VN238_21825 [Solirubrobacteraceae bacterium]|nr:hypothetical protein [Solirubrobacteraceae bacterium]